jgi:Ricin-type beta-trefoil lectin domain
MIFANEVLCLQRVKRYSIWPRKYFRTAMPTSLLPRVLIGTIVALVGFVTVLLDGAANTAEARQCVWNKSGAVLGVSWYRPADLLKTDNGDLYLRPGATSVQKDVFPVLQGKCQRTDEELVAVLICEHCEWVKKGLNITFSVFGAILTAVVCTGTAGAGCGAAAGVVIAIVNGGVMALPDAKQLQDQEQGAFAIVTPPQDRWLDVWGTVFDMQNGPGGTRWFDNNDGPTCSPCYAGINISNALIQHQLTARCLDSNEGRVYLLPCYGNNFQKWEVVGQTIRHLLTGRCLDSSEGRVYTLPCNGNEFQKWDVAGDTIRHKLDGWCLDGNANGKAANDDGAVYTHVCQGGNVFQRWASYPGG